MERTTVWMGLMRWTMLGRVASKRWVDWEGLGGAWGGWDTILEPSTLKLMG